MTIVEKIKDLTFNRTTACKRHKELVAEIDKTKREHLDKVREAKDEQIRIRRIYDGLNVAQAERDSRQALDPLKSEEKEIVNLLFRHKLLALVEAEEKNERLIQASLTLEVQHKDSGFLMGAVATKRIGFDMASSVAYRAVDARRRALAVLIFIATDAELTKAIAKVESDNPLPKLKEVTYERGPFGEWQQIA